MSLERNTSNLENKGELEGIKLELSTLQKNVIDSNPEDDWLDQKWLEDLNKSVEEITGKKSRIGLDKKKGFIDIGDVVRDSVYSVCGISNSLKKNNVTQNIVKGAIDQAIITPGELVKKFKNSPGKCLKALYKLVRGRQNALIDKVIDAFGEFSINTPKQQYRTGKRAVRIVIDLLD